MIPSIRRAVIVLALLVPVNTRAQATEPLSDHPTHDNTVNYMLLFDQMEWHTGDNHTGFNWDAKGWIGKDKDRFWYRTEGLREDDRIPTAQAHLLYSRMIGRWWDLVAGVREDFRPGDPQTWAAVGIQGLAPYWIEVEATAYLGAGGRNHYRLELEHELRLTNRLIVQPQVEMEVFGKDDLAHGFGAGLSTVDTAVRLRYEIKREFAPYVGVSWRQRYFGTADAARAANDITGGSRVAVGVRFWM